MKVFSKGFNYSQDGRGNRLVYHLQGCNFRCPWCSNPEGMKGEGNAREYSANEMLEEIISCRAMYFDGGGVTFTGGEATLWACELLSLLPRIRESGINVCIETNGSSPRLFELSEHIDQLIMDIKHYDRELHLKWTGDDGSTTLENLKRLTESGREILVRIPLIKGVNTDADGFLELFSSFNCERVSFEFLPYHEYGRDKWTEEYTMTDAFITPEIYSDFKEKFERKGYKVIRT